MSETTPAQRILDVVGASSSSSRATTARRCGRSPSASAFTKAALYYHFRSKDEILRALLEPANEILDRADRATRGGADGSRRVGRRAGVGHRTRSSSNLDFFRLVERNRQVTVSDDGGVRVARAHHARCTSASRRPARGGVVRRHRAGADGRRARRGHRLRRLGADVAEGSAGRSCWRPSWWRRPGGSSTCRRA